MTSVTSTTVLCTMKNEAPFIVEWLAYHKVIGFDKFVIFSNDSTDGTTEILNALNDAGEIIHHYQEINPNQVISKVVAKSAVDSNYFNDGDWVIWLDADEFLNVHVGDGKVQDLIQQIETAQGICVGWRVFGDSNQKIFKGRFISSDFTNCASQGKAWNNVKTLFQYDENLDHLFQHKPIMNSRFWEEKGTFLGPNGLPMPKNTELMKHWIAGRARGNVDRAVCGWELAQINHYAVRTKALFKYKQDRGRIGASNDLEKKSRYTSRYFSELNCNDVKDTSILEWETKVSDEVDRLLSIFEMKETYFELVARNYDSSVLKATGLLTPPQTPEKDPPLEYSEIINVKGIKIPFIKKIITPKIENSMRRNRYEGSEIRLAQSVIQKHDCVLEIGAGVGALSVAISVLDKAKEIISVEANPELIPIIQETHKLNGTNNVKVINAIVSSSDLPTLKFYCREDFWSSSLEPDSIPYRDCIEIDNLNIDDLLEDYNPAVIVCDIEGGELELFDLSVIRVLGQD